MQLLLSLPQKLKSTSLLLICLTCMAEAMSTSDPDSLKERNLSHHEQDVSFEASVHKIRDKITQRQDLPHISVDKQLKWLDLLTECDLGRFLIERGGLNGYWTYRVVSYPTLPIKPLIKNVIEEFLFNKAPTCLATQQRFQIFKKELQKRVSEGAVFASVPCGLMADLIELDFSRIFRFALVGIDIDAEAIAQGQRFANEHNISENCTFLQRDAWALSINDRFDVLTSNGLSIYEPNDERVIDLYREFFKAIKPGGYLITSYLTPPPIPGQVSEWNLAKVSTADALLQKIIFADILNCKWQIFRSSKTVKSQLESAGFESIEFIHDEASIFPTVVARKPLRAKMRTEIQKLVSSISPLDEEEKGHVQFAKIWIESGAPLFRIEKPATPDPHLVSYFVLVDKATSQILLVDHKKAGLWLPPGGHVELNEHPKKTVEREIQEELGIQAHFLSPDPFFITVTKTVGQTAGHTDVSLWYLLEGRASEFIQFDSEEFTQVRWFLPQEIPYHRVDPHMRRCMRKLALILPHQENERKE